MTRGHTHLLSLAALGLVVSSGFALSLAGESVEDLMRLGNETYEAQDWTACGDYYAKASQRAGARVVSSASYNAACCYALAGRVDRAFNELDRAAAAGLRDLARIKQDGDLRSLHEDPRWDAVLGKVEAAEQAYLAGINEELLELYRQDQQDRHGQIGQIDWSKVAARDAQRRERVLAIMASGDSWVADDYFHAAMVFQHGSEPEEVKRAMEWASLAAELDPEHSTAVWLSAAAEDRYLMYLGKPQKYGTQFKKIDGRWVLWDVDPSVTDEERAKKRCPPLAQAQARAEAMN